MKRNVNYQLDEELKLKFKMTTMLLKRTEVSVIEELIRDYIIKNKAYINSIVAGKNNNETNE